MRVKRKTIRWINFLQNAQSNQVSSWALMIVRFFFFLPVRIKFCVRTIYFIVKLCDFLSYMRTFHLYLLCTTYIIATNILPAPIARNSEMTWRIYIYIYRDVQLIIACYRRTVWTTRTRTSKVLISPKATIYADCARAQERL